MLSLVIAIPLLYFPGGDLLASMAKEDPNIIDTKQEIIMACIEYDQSSVPEQLAIRNQIRIEEMAYMEALHCEIQMDSAYQAQVSLLTLNTQKK